MVGMASMSVLRVAGRLANAFTLDLIKRGGYGGDVIDALLQAAILDSNLGHLMHGPAGERDVSRPDLDPPDEARRPVSIYAISASLRVPYETVRRRIGRLSEAGVCAVTSRGVVIPQRATSSRVYRALVETQYDRLQALHARLDAIGALGALPRAGAWEREPPLPLLGVLVAQYVLRFTEPVLEQVRDPVSALILLEIILANTERWPDHEGGGEGAEAAAFVPDSRRIPVKISELSRRLGISYQMVRRHVLWLGGADFCRRTRGGYIVPAEALARPEVLAFAMRNYSGLLRLFADLGRYGLLSTATDGAQAEQRRP